MPTRKTKTKIVPYSARKRKNARRRATAPEKSIHAMLQALKIDFVKEKAIGLCHVDVFVEPETAIEVLGCYWHKHDCQEPEGGWSAADLAVQKKDAARFVFLASRGYTVMLIWECDIEKHPEKVMARLKKLKR